MVMIVLNFIISIIALIIAVLAYQRSAGSNDLKTQLNALREKSADALANLEKALRKQGKDAVPSSTEDKPE